MRTASCLSEGIIGFQLGGRSCVIPHLLLLLLVSQDAAAVVASELRLEIWVVKPVEGHPDSYFVLLEVKLCVDDLLLAASVDEFSIEGLLRAVPGLIPDTFH